MLAVAVVASFQGFVYRDLQIQPFWLPPALALVVLGGGSIVLRLGWGPGVLKERSVAFATLVALSVSSLVALVELMAQLIGDSRLSGERLLLDGAVLWLTNVAVFSLWYHELDSGGPRARARGEVDYPDLLFAQQATPEVARSDWKPRYLDYLYVGFTTATAFSPTDTMPLARWMKMVMLGQSLVSLILAAVVISRAVNVL